jgi:ATP-dependent Zn protease
MSPTSSLLATAYHEAGHAVIALALGRSIQRVSIEPNQMRLGHCEFKKGSFRPTDDIVEMEMLILLGGLAAEARHTGLYGWDEASQDLREVRILAARRAGNARKAERVEKRMLDKTEHLLEQPGVWTAVERIADELVRCTTISGRAARHLFDSAMKEASE